MLDKLWQLYCQICKFWQTSAYPRLFTDTQANITPAISKLAKAKQLVVNEFIALNLALGGFKAFGDSTVIDGVPLNYPAFTRLTLSGSI